MSFHNALGDYGSHFPVLAGLASDANSILECGVGHWSTPMLHFISNAKGIDLLSCESDGAWLWQFGEYESNLHKFLLVTDWLSEPKIHSEKWDLAFVDCKPGEIRAPLIQKLKSVATYIVVHDTETNSGARYQYEPVFDQFKYRWDWKRYRPNTTVVSNFKEIPF